MTQHTLARLQVQSSLAAAWRVVLAAIGGAASQGKAALEAKVQLAARNMPGTEPQLPHAARAAGAGIRARTSR